MEQPERREFKEKDLLRHISSRRGELLTALFTILRGYQLAGSPGQHDSPLGRFEPWSATVAAPLRWLGFPDPVDSQKRLRDQDPESDQLELLLSAWFAEHGSTWLTAGGKVI